MLLPDFSQPTQTTSSSLLRCRRLYNVVWEAIRMIVSCETYSTRFTILFGSRRAELGLFEGPSQKRRILIQRWFNPALMWSEWLPVVVKLCSFLKVILCPKPLSCLIRNQPKVQELWFVWNMMNFTNDIIFKKRKEKSMTLFCIYKSNYTALLLVQAALNQHEPDPTRMITAGCFQLMCTVFLVLFLYELWSVSSAVLFTVEWYSG